LRNKIFIVFLYKVNSKKNAKEALFAYLLHEAGQNLVTDFLNELKAEKKLKNRSDYTKLKTELNKIGIIYLIIVSFISFLHFIDKSP